MTTELSGFQVPLPLCDPAIFFEFAHIRASLFLVQLEKVVDTLISLRRWVTLRGAGTSGCEALEYDKVVLPRQAVLPAAVVEREVVLLAVIRRLPALHVHLCNILPVSESTLHDPLD